MYDLNHIFFLIKHCLIVIAIKISYFISFSFHLFGTLNMVHEVQLVNNNMTEQLNSDPRTLKSLFSL